MSFMVFVLWPWAFGLWPLAFGLWSLAFGLWPLAFGLRSLAFGSYFFLFTFYFLLFFYSHLSATNGSTFVARRAGIRQAAIATNASNPVTATYVSGSLGFTSNKSPVRKR